MPVTPSPTRVAIVDDHEVVALAIGAIVDEQEGLEYVGRCADVGELFARGPRAELVVLDLNLRDGSLPSDNVARLTAWGARVLVVTSAENPYLVREVSRSDALGIVRKSAPVAELADAIARAAAGEPIVTTEWAAAVDADADFASAPLTERERQVLSLYASGLGAKAVARQLGVSENTVDDHIRRIKLVYQQLCRPAHTKVELFQRGVEDGYLPMPAQR